MILHIQMIFSLHLGHFKTWFHIKEVWLFKQRIWHPLDPKDGLPLHRLLFLIINKRRYNYIKPKSTSPSNNLILPISFTQLKPICRASIRSFRILSYIKQYFFFKERCTLVYYLRTIHRENKGRHSISIHFHQLYWLGACLRD